MNKQEFMMIASFLRGAFRKSDFLKDATEGEAWYECLMDIDVIWLKKAVIQWTKENKFPPTIAEIRELAQKIEEQEYASGKVKRWQ